MQAVLQHVGQALRVLVASATDATAQGVAAAGIEVGLPEEVLPLRSPTLGQGDLKYGIFDVRLR